MENPHENILGTRDRSLTKGMRTARKAPDSALAHQLRTI